MSKTLDWAEGHLGLAKSGNLDELVIFPEDLEAVIEELKRAEKKVQELEAENERLQRLCLEYYLDFNQVPFCDEIIQLLKNNGLMTEA